MTLKKQLILLFLAFFSIVACKTSQTNTAIKSLPSSNGRSVIIAEIIEVSDERSFSFPCSEVPCIATVRIEKVERSSAKLMQPFVANQEGNMRFVFSLNETTEKLFPNLDKRLAGLKAGDRFRANVTQEQLVGSNTTQWVAYEYILLH